MKRTTIRTIGYEGADIGAFLDALTDAGVETLIDVREVALSRKKGFSKTQLGIALAARGIRYVHLRGLGDPKPGREAARAGNYPLFRRLFTAHLRTATAQADLAAAAMLVQTQRSCLMCFEADHEQCHRTIVADALALVTGGSVSHLQTEPLARKRIAA